MENYKAQIAFALVPILKHLYSGGIIAVSGMTGEVHMTPAAFHETFPEITEREDRMSDQYPFIWKTTVEGVTFFALEAE